MNSFRRELIDQYLFENEFFIVGDVLDIGGNKNNTRGKFKSFKANRIKDWKYLNKDNSSNPDYIIDLDKEISIKDKKFDTLIMTEVLEYLKDPKYTLSQLHYIMNDSAVIIITVPFLNPIHGDYLYDRARYSEISLKELASVTNFEVIQLKTMGSLGTVLFDILRVSFSRNNNRIFFRMLKLFKFFFKFIDKRFLNISRYVNSGYFVILKKK